MRYMVMENNISFSVVLDEEGRFINVANMGYEVGQTINHIIPLNKNKKTILNKQTIFAFYSIAACFLFSLIFYYQSITTSVYGSVYLTINPKVKMDISKNGKVRDILALNEDGKAIIENINVKGIHVSQISNILIDKSIELEMLDHGGQVNIYIETPDDDKWFQKIGINLRENVNLHVDNKNMDIKVKIFKFEEAEDYNKENIPKDETTIPSDSVPIKTEDANIPSDAIPTKTEDTNIINTNKPTAPPATVAPTNKPTAPPATVAPTEKPTAPPATVAPTEKPTAPPVTVAPTEKPTAPPVTVAPTEKTTAPPEPEFIPSPVLNNDDDDDNNNSNDDSNSNNDDNNSNDDDDNNSNDDNDDD